MDLPDVLFSTPEMSAVFSGTSRVRRMLEVEAALARAQARLGIIPSDAAEAIAVQCRVELFDVERLFEETRETGVPTIPLVRALAEKAGEVPGRYVHWGATSQDVVDTGMVLQAREGLALLERRLREVGAACAELAERHRRTVMAGRTLLQQAVPVTFGLKAARWLALVTRRISTVRRVRRKGSVLQFGGASGTLAALGVEGLQVAELLADELGLEVPEMPWHAERDRMADVAGGLATVAGAMGKIARDLVLLAQSEVAEVAEGQSGGSSSMPQKRNPTNGVQALAAARLAGATASLLVSGMEHEHERGSGGWQAEWAAVPALFRYTACAVERVGAALDGLEVDAGRMRQNLDRSNGLIMAEALTMALAVHLGRRDGHRLVGEACRRAAEQGISLHEAAAADERIRDIVSPEDLGVLLDPEHYLGSTDLLIDRALEAFRAETAPSP
jgi:3-carboxy-cis,cis-muconate cycloisomerase